MSTCLVCYDLTSGFAPARNKKPRQGRPIL